MVKKLGRTKSCNKAPMYEQGNKRERRDLDWITNEAGCLLAGLCSVEKTSEI